MSYSSEKSLWNYVDTNDFARYPEEKEYIRLLSTDTLENNDNLIKSIMESFSTNPYVLMNTKVLAINKDSLPFKELKESLNQLDLKYSIDAEQINYLDSNDSSLLSIACQNGNLKDVITILTHEKAFINQTENQDPLSSKINAKPNAVKETTIDNYIANINKPNNNGATSFFIACQNGHLEVVKEFLASSLFKRDMINTVGITGHTPLLVACLSPHTINKKELFELLLKHGANLTHKNEANQTAMDIAIAQDNQAALSVLKQNMVLPVIKKSKLPF